MGLSELMQLTVTTGMNKTAVFTVYAVHTKCNVYNKICQFGRKKRGVSPNWLLRMRSTRISKCDIQQCLKTFIKL